MPGKDGKDVRVVMLDSWKPQNLMTSQYIWLPIEWQGEKPVLPYKKTWKLPAPLPKAEPDTKAAAAKPAKE